MDDLKLIGKTEEELQKQMQIFTIFSDDIHREFGLEMCTKIVLKKNKIGSLTKFNTLLQQSNTRA